MNNKLELKQLIAGIDEEIRDARRGVKEAACRARYCCDA